MQPTDTDSLHASLRDLLVKARNKRKLTQGDIAERLGESQIWVSRYETGPRKLDVAEFVLIARAIGVDPCLLLRRVEGASGSRKSE